MKRDSDSVDELNLSKNLVNVVHKKPLNTELRSNEKSDNSPVAGDVVYTMGSVGEYAESIDKHGRSIDKKRKSQIAGMQDKKSGV